MFDEHLQELSSLVFGKWSIEQRRRYLSAPNRKKIYPQKVRSTVFRKLYLYICDISLPNENRPLAN